MNPKLPKIIADLELIASKYEMSNDPHRRTLLEMCMAYNLTKLERYGGQLEVQKYRHRFLTMTADGLGDAR